MKIHFLCTVIVSYTLLFAGSSSPECGKTDNIHGKGYVQRFSERDLGLHDIGNIELQIDDVGGQEGWWFTHIWPKTSPIHHLYWNWLAIGYSPIHVSDAWDGDWSTTVGGNIVITEPGTLADEEGYAQFHDPINGFEVTQQSFAWQDSAHDDYVIVKYTVCNINSIQFDSLYIGHRTDFDVMGDHGSAMTDMGDCDTTRHLAYMWDVGSPTHVGVKLLKGNLRGYKNTGWYQGSDAEKFFALSDDGIDSITPGYDDWCIWLSTGPYEVAQGDSVVVAFAFLGGDDLASLQENADSAQAMWHSIGVEEHVALDAQTHDMLQIKPNPFRRLTNVSFEVDSRQKSVVSVQIYDISGRIVKAFGSIPYAPGPMHIVWDGCDDSGTQLPGGVYICRLETDGTSVQKKIVLLR